MTHPAGMTPDELAEAIRRVSTPDEIETPFGRLELRLYGPLEPWFDGSWRLPELVKA
ncbi:hypothetical protein [Agromyces sp. NPDC058104]|uniref:hypothetical protein n=1 Tax=Agromyces sp. NPDC058104 TaxID=3346342 RepID=UPI0036D78A54